MGGAPLPNPLPAGRGEGTRGASNLVNGPSARPNSNVEAPREPTSEGAPLPNPLPAGRGEGTGIRQIPTRFGSTVMDLRPLPRRAYDYFLPYQKRWIADRSRLRIFEKSRQIGISLCTAFHLVRKTSRDNNPYDAWVTSRDEMQARLFGADCAVWAGVLQLSVRSRGLRALDADNKSSAFHLRFDNKRSIHCLSPNAVRKFATG